VPVLDGYRQRQKPAPCDQRRQVFSDHRSFLQLPTSEFFRQFPCRCRAHEHGNFGIVKKRVNPFGHATIIQEPPDQGMSIE
jgi:hypothetical protein